MLRVVCYNIHSGRDLFWRKRLTHMANTLKALEADVIGLQEVHQNSRFGFQASYLADRLQYEMAFSPSITFADGHFGNALLTRLPLKEYAICQLPARKEKRTLLQTVLSWQGIDISVWNTHCSLNQASRSSQLQQIAALAGSQMDMPRLLLGDFNASDVSFTPILVDCAIEQGKEKMPTLPAFRRRLDYVFASTHWQVANYRLLPVSWSDHVPLIAELVLP